MADLEELSLTADPLVGGDTGFVHAFGVFLTFSKFIPNFCAVNHNGMLPIFVRFQPNPLNICNTIVSVSLQNRKTSRMDTKNHEIPQILKYINLWQFVGVGS